MKCRDERPVSGILSTRCRNGVLKGRAARLSYMEKMHPACRPSCRAIGIPSFLRASTAEHGVSVYIPTDCHLVFCDVATTMSQEYLNQDGFPPAMSLVGQVNSVGNVKALIPFPTYPEPPIPNSLLNFPIRVTYPALCRAEPLGEAGSVVFHSSTIRPELSACNV